MGEMVHFPLSGSRRDNGGAARHGEPCQILLFTGVRYERHAEPEPATPAPARIAPETSGRRRRARRRA